MNCCFVTALVLSRAEAHWLIEVTSRVARHAYYRHLLPPAAICLMLPIFRGPITSTSLLTTTRFPLRHGSLREGHAAKDRRDSRVSLAVDFHGIANARQFEQFLNIVSPHPDASV